MLPVISLIPTLPSASQDSLTHPHAPSPALRAEDSFTHRHLCEFMGLDFEMQIYEHYFEVMDVIETLFEHIFNGLATKYGELPQQQQNRGVRSPLSSVV